MNNYLSNIYLDKDAREALMRGVNGVADAVKLTLGAGGGNAILYSNLYPNHLITNDGKSIAELCVFTHPVEQMGANLVKEIAQKSDRDSGDGTTTSTVLLQSILKEGMKVEASPMEIKRSLDECLLVINASLDKQKKDITVDEVGQVATISSESETLGAIFQEIYQKIGKDGIVELDTSNLPETSYEITDGVRLRNAGFTYPYMANQGKYAVYKNPKILITKQKIATLQDIDPLFRTLSEEGKPELVIFCEDIDPAVSQALAQTHMQGIFKTLVIKAPTLWKDWIYEDFAKITGATIVDPAQGQTLKHFDLRNLGTCEQITTSKSETVVRGIQDISSHIKALKDIGTEETKIRLAWLQTKTAILKLGANSESELSYIRLKAEDARNASYLALQDGVVAGGGIALFNAIKDLPDTIGGQILTKVLKTPLEQIILNTGMTIADKPKNPKGTIFLGDDVGGESGFNAKTLSFVNMWDAGIIDPAKVVKNSIKNAISVAGIVLTARVVVVEKPKSVV